MFWKYKLIFVFTMIMFAFSILQADYLYIDDFDDGDKMNMLGQVWFDYSYHIGTSSATNLNHPNILTNNGKYGSQYCAYINYSMTFSGGANYNGIALSTPLVPSYDPNTNVSAAKTNLSSYNNGQLSFWLKGPNSPNFKIQIRTKNIDQNSGQAYAHVETIAVSGSWQKVNIPFRFDDNAGGLGSATAFDQPNWVPVGSLKPWLQSISNLQKIEFQYESTTTSGRFYIDDLTITSYADTTSPNKVSNIILSQGETPGSVQFKFPMPDSDVYKYVVAYSTNTNSIVVATNEQLFSIAENHKTIYSSPTSGTDTLIMKNLIPERNYYFRIVACDRAANYGTNISAMLNIETPGIPSGVWVEEIIDNLEDGNIINRLVGTWYTFNDSADEGNSVILPYPFSVTSPGYSISPYGGQYCASYSYTLGNTQYPTVGLGTTIPGLYKNFHNYKALGFYLKGNGKNQTVYFNTKFNDPLGNYDYYSYSISATSSEWKRYIVPIDVFQQAGWGTVIDKNSAFSNIEGITFRPTQTPGETGEMYYDDIVLLNGNLSSLATRIIFSPNRVQLIPGETKQLNVVGIDDSKNIIILETNAVTYQVIEGNAGIVNKQGEFTALQYGYAQVKATSTVKDSQGNSLIAYATIDVVSDRLQKERLTIGPNLINTKTMSGILPRIRFYLDANQEVTIEIFNELGYPIRTILKKQVRDAGVNGENWDLKDDKGDLVASGLYLIRMSTGNFVKTVKIVIVN